jgi:hypothetical protein
VKRRFLSFQLGDNDFGSDMRLAMEHLWAQHCDVLPTAPLDKIKQAMICLMVGSHAANVAIRERPPGDSAPDHLVNYFQKARMLESDAPSTADGDHSYVSIDLSTGYIWVH